MSGFGDELARLMTARGVGVRELARIVYCNPGHISNLRSGKANPSPELAQSIDNALGAGGMLVALAPAPGPRARQSPATWDQATKPRSAHCYRHPGPTCTGFMNADHAPRLVLMKDLLPERTVVLPGGLLSP